MICWKNVNRDKKNVKMKILLITSEEWNDYVYGNGVLTNWFTGFHAEFAQIYGSPGKPINDICDRYFQITDMEMAKSLVGIGKAGHIIQKETDLESINISKQNAQRMGVYGFMKKASMWIHVPILMLRDFIWYYGRYNTESLKAFVNDFQPDIVFCPRLISPKLMRLENLVSTMTKAPFVAFTGDNEASMEGISFSPLYWLRKFYIHKMFGKHVHLYAHYFMSSVDQAKEYAEQYHIPTSVLFKCASFPSNFTSKPIGTPIRLVYAGRLYCNRWKSLAEIGKALQIINKDGIRMVLDIYTQEELTKGQRAALSEDKYIYVKGSVTPEELKRIYKNADIALHVESMDKKNRLLTRVSFSTKIIDLMASSCAIMAICWEKHAGYQYLKNNDAAFCCSDYQSILPQLQKICETPTLITEYQKKAYECGKRNHNREGLHKQLANIFENIINKNSRK